MRSGRPKHVQIIAIENRPVLDVLPVLVDVLDHK